MTKLEEAYNLIGEYVIAYYNSQWLLDGGWDNDEEANEASLALSALKRFLESELK